VFPGSLTSLTCLGLTIHRQLFDPQGAPATSAAQPEPLLLAKAISGLTDLRDLSSNYYTGDAAAQRRALQQLQQLTEPRLRTDSRSVRVQKFDLALQNLTCPEHIVRNPFSSTSLQRLEAASLVVDEQWEGKTAQGCQIREHVVGRGLASRHLQQEGLAVDDTFLRSLPLMLQLERLMYVNPGSTRHGRLAELLARQAGTLQDIEITDLKS
jgi:hypothetical protein